MNTTVSFNYIFPLENGLHARPASFIETKVKNYKDCITITNLKNNKVADTRSVLSMIASDIALNDELVFEVCGDNADSTSEHFRHFLDTEFIHCDQAIEAVGQHQKKPLPYMLQNVELNSLNGLPVSAGTAEGKAMILGKARLTLDPVTVEKGNTQEERRRFNQARENAIIKMEQQVTSAKHEEGEIIQSHLSLLNDEKLIHSILNKIEAGDSILSAILESQNHYEEVLNNTSSEYLRERVLDIQDVCTKLIEAVYGENSFEKNDHQLNDQAICIAETLTPSQFLAMDRRLLKGLVLEAGGTTSHTVILARSYGIPVIVGAEHACDFVNADESVILDANLGMLIKQPSKTVCRYYELEQVRQARLLKRREKYIHKKSTTLDGHHLEVAANIASAEEAEAAFSQGAESIGLFRTEMLYMDRSEPPCEEEQFEIYKKALVAANNKPVIIRTMDIGGDKPVDYFNIGKEDNPFLGYRAIRLYSDYLPLFETQLRAMLRASIYGRCKIMVPMVATLSEARWLRETFNHVVSTLSAEGVAINANVELGIMMEVPSSAFIIDQLVKYVDFFSIGSNDLTQYLLAADRGNRKVEYLYDSLNPAFLRLLKHIVDAAHQSGVWVGMCGEFAGKPEHLPLLLGLGLDEISLSAPNILEVKETISLLTAENSKEILTQALNKETSEDVATLLQQSLQERKSMAVLAEHSIIVDADCHTKAEVIKTLVDNLHVNGRVSDLDATEAAIWNREAISPTMLGFGIAIPHCKSDAVAASSISIMKLAQPILWNEGDTVKTDTVFMLTVRENEAGNTHMKIFAQLARRIMRETFRNSLAACRDKQELLTFISNELDL